MFALDYFGGPAYLAQSPQFYKQTMVGVFERVYEVGPVFRAEPHDTVRHLAEYVSLDAEFGFIQDHRDVLAVLRSTVAGMLAAVGERASGALERLGVDAAGDPGRRTGAALQRGAQDRRCGPGRAGPGAGRRACRSASGRCASTAATFVAVEGYPMVKRPFYTHPQPSDPRWSNSFDLLFRGVELVTGGQRLHRYSDYVASL